jgi:hypothetical protein
MTTKQKCEKLANVLETVATKLRDTSIGTKVWEAEEPSLQILVAQLATILKRATDISNDIQPEPKKRGSQSKRIREYDDEWPDVIAD